MGEKYMGEKSVEKEALGEGSLGKKYMGEKSVGEKPTEKECLSEESLGEKYVCEKPVAKESVMKSLRVIGLWVKSVVEKFMVEPNG